MHPVDRNTGLTQERLKSLLSYDPLTGVFYWKVQRPNGVKVGDAAGSVIGGYVKIKIAGHSYHASRLAWFYMTGMWPVALLDHDDTDKLNNIWTNLREANRSQNGANRGGCGAVSGMKGAHYSPGRNSPKKWAATIRVNGRNKTLGYFNTPQEAHSAYVKAADQFFGVFANGGDDS